MPIIGNKSLVKCVARTKIYSLGDAHFWRVYLWEDSESLQAACGFEKDGMTKGAHCPMFARQTMIDGELRMNPCALMGEIHFVAEEWDEEIVSHECCHAAFQYGRNTGTMPDIGTDKDAKNLDSEEIFCYLQGNLMFQAYRWLWEVDPSSKWKRRVK